jgi:cytochrome c-type biogenesis protein CcmH
MDMSTTRAIFALATGLFLATMAGVAHAEPPSAKAIEARLYAPCCYTQTLDVHDSEIAHTLRAEIEQRVARGDTAEAIDADLVERYGPQIHAIPSWGPSFIPGAALVGILLGSVLLATTVRRWRMSASAQVAAPTPGPGEDEADRRLDDELSALDS